jgi:hypothetical protein
MNYPLTKEQIILALCGMIKIEGVDAPAFEHPRRAGVDWESAALTAHPAFDHFVALSNHDDQPHNADTIRAAWSWFQAGWHATAARASHVLEAELARVRAESASFEAELARVRGELTAAKARQRS